MKLTASMGAILVGLVGGAEVAAGATLDRAEDWSANSEKTKIVRAGDRLLVKDAPFYVFSAKKFDVKPGMRYRVQAKFRNPASKKGTGASFGVQMFDAEGKNLCGSNSSEIRETFTTLVKPIAKGDRTIHVKDALYWSSGMVAFGAKADGSDFPNRNILSGVKAVKRLAADDWEVELVGASRTEVPAGTGVRLQPGGPAYFFGQESRQLDGGWNLCRGLFSLEGGEDTAKFYAKTASFRLVAYDSLGRDITMEFKDAEVKEESLGGLEGLGGSGGLERERRVLSVTPDYRAAALNKAKFLATPKHAELKLIENGRLRFAIVAALKEERDFTGPDGLKLQEGQKSVAQAVKVLCEGFDRACGKRPVVIEPDDPALENWPYWIVVGKNALTDKLGMRPYELPQEGFEVRTFDRGIAIAGMDGFRIPGKFDLYDFRSRRMNCNGTTWGAWDFLERFLDQRHYYAREGMIVPKLAKGFTVKPVAYTDEPQYWNRGYHLNLGSFRAGNSSRFFGGESPHPFDVIKAFPDKTNELFVTQKGKLQCDPKTYGSNFFDISNPVFAETLAGAFAKYFETKGEYNPFWGGTFIPNSEWCWFGQCDRGGLIETKWSKDLIERNLDKDNHLTPSNYPASAAMSSVYADFFDRFGRLMEKAAPGRKVSCEVYSDYLFPPTKWKKKFPDNIRIMTCYGTPPMVKNEGFRKAYRQVYEGWNRLCADKVVPYIYSAGWSFGAGIQLSLQGWYMGDWLKEYADVIDNRNAYACLCGWTKDYFYTMNLCARAMWNPDFDKQAVMDEFWERFYPPAAAKPLKAFHDRVIDIWETKTMPKNPDTYVSSLAGPRYANLYATFDREWMLDTLAKMDEARRAVVPGTADGARVEKFMKPWLMLCVARLDGAGQRMSTDIRPNRVPPALKDGVFRWTDYAWNRWDFLGTQDGEPCVGFAPKGKANPYADDWYRRGAELMIGGGTNTVAKFSIELKAAHHPQATKGEVAAAKPVEAGLWLNGRELKRVTLKDGGWRPVSVTLPAGSLREGKKAQNFFAVTNLTTVATKALPTSWLAVRAPQLKFAGKKEAK